MNSMLHQDFESRGRVPPFVGIDRGYVGPGWDDALRVDYFELPIQKLHESNSAVPAIGLLVLSAFALGLATAPWLMSVGNWAAMLGIAGLIGTISAAAIGLRERLRRRRLVADAVLRTWAPSTRVSQRSANSVRAKETSFNERLVGAVAASTALLCSLSLPLWYFFGVMLIAPILSLLGLVASTVCVAMCFVPTPSDATESREGF